MFTFQINGTLICYGFIINIINKTVLYKAFASVISKRWKSKESLLYNKAITQSPVYLLAAGGTPTQTRELGKFDTESLVERLSLWRGHLESIGAFLST